jgi:cytochrome c-type biogenesis protein CcmH/NrfF
MRRWLLPAAAAGLAIAAVAVLVAVAQPAPPVTRDQQARALAAELRCPDCESLSIAESQTTAAAAIRAEIDQQLADGRTLDQVRASLVARYGEWILLQPANPLIWLAPLGALLIGVALFGWWLLGRRRIPSPPPADAAAAVASEERQRVRNDAELLDG